MEKKSNFYFPRIHPIVPLDKELQWVNAKKVIQTDLATQAYPEIVQTYSGIFKALCNPGIFRIGISRTLTYSDAEAFSESWHIHNPGIFITPAYSECWHIQNTRHIQNPGKHLP